MSKLRFQNVWEVRQFGLLAPMLQEVIEVALERRAQVEAEPDPAD